MKDNISNNPIEALAEIKKMMQQSTRIFSLSGWSGVWAGCVALLGVYAFYFFKNNSQYTQAQNVGNNAIDKGGVLSEGYVQQLNEYYSIYSFNTAQKEMLLWLAMAVFVLAVAGAIFFSVRKNKKNGYKSNYTTIARKLVINLLIPIGVGGVFCLHFLNVGEIHYLAPCSLVFYGLGLINSSKYTFSDIKYLGLFEVLLGITALFFMKYHLFIWAIGFGILHIGYGIYMWVKYDKQ